MNIKMGENAVEIELFKKEKFYVKDSFLQEVGNHKLNILPKDIPHKWGSVIARCLHDIYWLKSVDGPGPFSIRGEHGRGDFFYYSLSDGEEIYILPECVVGFSSEIKNIHTKIHIGPTFFVLKRYFFSVFTGPGHVLLYTPDLFENTENLKLKPERVIAFDIKRSFIAKPLESDDKPTQFMQFFRHDVIWEFRTEGKTLCVKHYKSDASGQSKNVFRKFIEHILGFFRFA